jgi:hypothetical protein
MPIANRLEHPRIKAFIKHVRSECRRTGIKVELRQVKYLRLGQGMKCSGYFDEENKKLVVAMLNPVSVEVLVHEFGHFTQWDEKIPIWKDAGWAMGHIEEWLNGKTKRNIEKWMSLSRDLELDNEKRSVQLIKDFNLPINTEKYTKSANAYVLFYNWMLTSRKWCKPGNTPYSNKTVLNACSPKFNMRYDQLSARMRQAFEESGI